MRLLKYALLLGAAVPAVAEPQKPEWPHQEDIVRAEPVAMAMAEENRLDVTRYLLVRGAGSFALSGDGRKVAYISDVTGVPQIWTEISPTWLSTTLPRANCARSSSRKRIDQTVH